MANNSESEEAQKLKQQIEYLTALIIHADDLGSASATYNRKIASSTNKGNDYKFISKSKHYYPPTSQSTQSKHARSVPCPTQAYAGDKSKPILHGRTVVKPVPTTKMPSSARSSCYGLSNSSTPQHTLINKSAASVVMNRLNTHVREPLPITGKSHQVPSIDKISISDQSRTTTTYKSQQTGNSRTVIMSSQVLPKQGVSGDNSSQMLPKQQVSGNISSPVLPKQQVSGNNSNQLVPKQQVSGKNSSQVLPKQGVSGNNSSLMLPKQQVSGNNSSQVLPKQQVSLNNSSQMLLKQQVSGNISSQVLPKKILLGASGNNSSQMLPKQQVPSNKSSPVIPKQEEPGNNSSQVLPKQRVSGNNLEYPAGQQCIGLTGNLIQLASHSMIIPHNTRTGVKTGVNSHLSVDHQSSNLLSSSVYRRSTASHSANPSKESSLTCQSSTAGVSVTGMPSCSSVPSAGTVKDDVNTRQVMLVSDSSHHVTRPHLVLAGASVTSTSLTKNISNLASTSITTSNMATKNSQPITYKPIITSLTPAGAVLANTNKILNRKIISLQNMESSVLSPMHSSKLILEQELAATDSRLIELQSEITKLSSRHDRSDDAVSIAGVKPVSPYKMPHSDTHTSKCLKQTLRQVVMPRILRDADSQSQLLASQWQSTSHASSLQSPDSVLSDRFITGSQSPSSLSITSSNNIASVKSPYKIVHNISQSHSAPSSPMASRVDVNFAFNPMLNTTYMYNVNSVQQGFHSADEDSSNSAFRSQRNQNSSLQSKGKVKSVPGKTSKYKIVHNKPYFPSSSSSLVVKSPQQKITAGLSSKHSYVASGVRQKICMNQQNKKTSKTLVTSRYKLINTDKKSVLKLASVVQEKARYVASKYKLKKMAPNNVVSSYKLSRTGPKSDSISEYSKGFVQSANYKTIFSTPHQQSNVTRYAVNRKTPKASRIVARIGAHRFSQGSGESRTVSNYKMRTSAIASRLNHQPRKLLWRSKKSLVYAPLKAGMLPWRHMQRTVFKYSKAHPYQRCRFLRQRPRAHIPKKCQLKLDRRLADARYSRSRMVVLNGMVYRSSKRKLTRSKNPAKMTTHPNVSSQTSGSHVKQLKSRNVMIINVRGVKFCLDSSGKTLHRVEPGEHTQTSLLNSGGQSLRTSVSDGAGTSLSAAGSGVRRVDIGGVTYVETAPGTLEKLTTMQTRQRTSRTINRSIQTTKAKSGRFSANKKYCMFYNRFGRCNRGDKCSFVHDPDKVAVCTRFLRGTCDISNCPFSHKLAKEKMPVCSYFLRGLCIRDNCPYSHVNVGRNAEVCSDFLRGYCALGEKCPKKHILDCPEYSRTGQCPAGDRCKLKHSRRKAAKRKGSATSRKTKADTSSAETVSDNVESASQHDGSADQLVQENIDDADDRSLPWKMRKLPAYISLDMEHVEISAASTVDEKVNHLPLSEDKGKLHIKPRLL